MPELTMLTTQLAKSPFIVWAWLLFLSRSNILRFRVSVDALLLNVAVPILLEKLADWYSFFDISV